MSATAYSVRRHTYIDSILLMRVARELGQRPGVLSAAALMATQANKVTLREAGFVDREVDSASPDDLVIGVVAVDELQAQAALTGIDELLSPVEKTVQRLASSFADAVALEKDANLALISVPGEFAAEQMRRALDHGLHVFCFSSNVRLEDEIELKRLGASRGLLVMGPDCGTAIIGGKGIGFANSVRRGPIGIVGASGTGMQAISCLVHHGGSGISHALGTGSRDPRDEVGGISTLTALEVLLDDSDTQIIVLVSKTPGATTLDRLKAAAVRSPKPVVMCFPGERVEGAVQTFEEAANRALTLAGCGTLPDSDEPLVPAHRDGHIVGLFAGGSLLLEAQGAMAIFDVSPAMYELVDMGSEDLTRGRPHPMIDPGPRIKEIARVGEDPAAAVLLLDIVLGFGAADDPAGDLAAAIRGARAAAAARGSELAVIASVVGTDEDVQNHRRQEAILRDAGVAVFSTSARAAFAAAKVVA